MTEITYGISSAFERLLWFVYRVLFTLLPSVLFFVILFVFCNAFYPDIINSIGAVFQNLGFAKWIILLAIVFFINTILEALTNFIVKFLDFSDVSKKCYEKEIDLTTEPSKFKNYFESKKSEVGNRGIFNLGILIGNQKSNTFNNYFWFLVAREFINTNTALVLILSSFILLPLCLYKNYEFSLWVYLLFQILQLLITFLVFWYSKRKLSDFYCNKKNKKNILCKSIILVFTQLFVASISIILFISDLEIFGVFILSNSILCFICPILFLRAFREFLHVEYLIISVFAKDDYDKEISETNKTT
ncbi:MAG: hypothetical protein FWH18_07310 [Marinilabiliaceae bacterium]|nr:hypothetical protein [Marinilabiliaceae bacterium]